MTSTVVPFTATPHPHFTPAPIWCAYLDLSCADRARIAEQGPRLTALRTPRTTMTLRTRVRAEIYSCGPMPPWLGDPIARGAAGVLKSTTQTQHRLTTIAAGLGSPIIGDPMITTQLGHLANSLPITHPLRRELTDLLERAQGLRVEHRLTEASGYPQLAIDALTRDTAAAGRSLVVRGAGILGRAVAAAGVEAGYARVHLLTRRPQRAHRALRGHPHLGALDIGHTEDPVPAEDWDMVVATDTAPPGTAAAGYRRTIDLAPPPREPHPDTDRYHSLDGPTLSLRIQRQNSVLAPRAARARAELASYFGQPLDAVTEYRTPATASGEHVIGRAR
ncbi:hypothetical protein ACTD5D_09730 [Nocardia takedensis]|uniref:hypothetical protein n=1 Tax=Nocardia takedensis TaxID=259390 RepID=UPI003F770DD2